MLEATVCVVAWSQPQSWPFPTTKAKILRDLTNLPNYVCVETIEPSQRRSRAQTFEVVERFRIDVAYISGRESFGWPEGEALSEEDITRLVAGSVGNGDFGQLLHSLFTSLGTLGPLGPLGSLFSDGTEERHDGRLALRYDYRIPLEASDWVLSVDTQRQSVAYHGSLWVDKDSLDLLELDSTADGIPRSLGIKNVDRVLQYARVRIGASTPLLPQRGVLVATQRNGNQIKSEVHF
jgi:hypothetical protein